jgi:hypothetical protein
MIFPLIALVGALILPSSDQGVPDSLLPSRWSAASSVHWQVVGRNLVIGGAVVGTIGTFAWLETVMFSIGEDLRTGQETERSNIPPAMVGVGLGTLVLGALIRLEAPDDPQDFARLEMDARPGGFSARLAWRL